MIKRAALAAIIISSMTLFARGSNPPGTTVSVGGVAEDRARAISWLPVDTETITVATGPFVFAANTLGENDRKDRAISDEELARSFEQLPLALLQFKNGLLAKHLEGKTINFALEGARHFRPPAQLGEMPYEGCAIVVFADNLRNEIGSFTKNTGTFALKTERIEDQDVAVFQEKMEQDTWTTFVAFPSEHMILAASDRNYLTEVLARLRGKIGQRALPSELPEWRYVSTSARFWGVRHYDKSQAQIDPSSPYGGRKTANFPDEQAIGLTFVFDPQGGRSATLTYLSRDPKIGEKASGSPLGLAQSSEAKGLSSKYRDLTPGVVQGAYSLQRLQALQFFLFALEVTLGHGVYL